MIKVNCGRCYPCLAKKRAEWGFRMQQETKYCESSAWITLTYDDENIPLAKDETPSLFKQDLVNFNKRVRWHIMNDEKTESPYYKILPNGRKAPAYRYLAVGEYGSQSKRPHYHLMAWNLPLHWIKWDPIHNDYYSNQLEDIWDLGFIHIGKIEQGSIHYQAKYQLKELIAGPHNDSMAIEPFQVMSRNPGIGQAYINDDIKAYYNNSFDPYATTENNYKQPLDRFYKDQIWDEEGRKVLTKKTRDFCIEEEKRQRREIEKAGGDFELQQIDQVHHRIKRLKTKEIIRAGI